MENDVLPGILAEACKKVEGITYCLENRTDRFGGEYEYVAFRWDGEICGVPEKCWIRTTREIIEGGVESPDSIVIQLLDNVAERRQQAEESQAVRIRLDELMVVEEAKRNGVEEEAGFLAEVQTRAATLALPDGITAVGYRTYTDDGVLRSFIKVDGPNGSKITSLDEWVGP